MMYNCIKVETLRDLSRKIFLSRNCRSLYITPFQLNVRFEKAFRSRCLLLMVFIFAENQSATLRTQHRYEISHTVTVT